MKCAICSQPATQLLTCDHCHKVASGVCDGYLCQPGLWKRRENEPRSVIPLMNMECEHCDGQLALSEAPREMLVPERTAPVKPSSLFVTTMHEARSFFFGKRFVLVTNVFGDGLGDLGQGAKFARQLREMGAEVTFVVCCLSNDREAIERTLGADVSKAFILSGPADFASLDRNPIPIAKVEPHKDGFIMGAVRTADRVFVFPTTAQLRKEHLEDASRYMQIEECVQFGVDLLGFGPVGAPTQSLAQTEQAKRRRLGVVLNNLGPCQHINIEQLENPKLQQLLLRGLEPSAWRAQTVFSVGYVKVPEGAVSLVSSPFGGKGHSPFGGKPHSSFGLMTSSSMKSSHPGLLPKSTGGSSSSGSGKNSFMDNFIRLMCVSTRGDETVSSVTLYCPNFKMTDSSLRWAQGPTEGGFTIHKGEVEGREVYVVSGNAGQEDFHRLLNEAALQGELRKRPVLVGAAGEGSLSEVLSIQTSGAVFPIYSPRYPYQATNLLRLAEELGDGTLRALLERIMKLHLESDPASLWRQLLETQGLMQRAQGWVHENYNFINLLYLRLMGRL